MSDYVLARGQKGARRLELLAAAMWPSTRAVLARAGIEYGARCLDVGCAIGTVSCEIARLSGHCKGIDLDAGYVQLARARASSRQVDGAVFEVADWQSLELDDEPYDFVYARYLLSHLSDPMGALQRMVSCAKPGATVVIEDVDFPGHFHHPRNAAFERYLQLYEQVVSAVGGNACFGRELLSSARQVGLVELEIELAVSLHNRGPGKLVAELTLEQIGEALTSRGLISEQELESLLSQLRDFRQHPDSQMSLAPTFQLVARVP